MKKLLSLTVIGLLTLNASATELCKCYELKNYSKYKDGYFVELKNSCDYQDVKSVLIDEKRFLELLNGALYHE